MSPPQGPLKPWGVPICLLCLYPLLARGGCFFSWCNPRFLGLLVSWDSHRARRNRSVRATQKLDGNTNSHTPPQIPSACNLGGGTAQMYSKKPDSPPPFFTLNFIYVYLFICICVCAPQASRSHWRSEEGIGSPGIGVTVIVR